MAAADKQGPDDEVLSRYLLGSLPAEEAERLDELSIVDDEFALRLHAVESDLVDAYARGELSKDALEQFQRFYLSSPRRRERVEFAKTLLRFSKGAKAALDATQPAIPDAKPTHQTSQSTSPHRWFSVPRSGVQWGFAVAAMALLFFGGYLFVENQRLRQQALEARNQQIALNQHALELEKQIDEQRSANDSLLKELGRPRESSPSPHALKIVGALLLPQMRGATQLPTVSAPVGTDQVHLRLQLESDDFPVYQVVLKDSAGSRVMWRKSDVKARAEGEAKVVSINIPAGLLKPHNYVLELTAVPSRGEPELLSSYAFKVVAN